MNAESLINQIRTQIEKGLPVGFSGLGIVLVEGNDCNLPISSLLSENPDLSKYKSENEIVDFIFEISQVSDRRHDGFHIVSLPIGLQNISQYFSPGIPGSDENTIFDVGARYRTAQYGSLCAGVILIIVVSQDGTVVVAKDGKIEGLRN